MKEVFVLLGDKEKGEREKEQKKKRNSRRKTERAKRERAHTEKQHKRERAFGSYPKSGKNPRTTRLYPAMMMR